MHKNLPPKSSQQGVVLLEALIAILIFSMGVLAIVGLQAAMIKNTVDSEFRTDASYIAQQRIGMIWADPDPSGAGYVSPVETNTDISSLLPGGTRTVTRTVPIIVNNPYSYTYAVTVTVIWQQPGQTQHNLITTASISGG